MYDQASNNIYRGRFAPSPTGSLHFGSLVTAVGSYLDAKFHRGEWLVRIEDLDPPREVPGAACDILFLLEKFGMEWDGEVVYQSQRHALYREVLSELERREKTYVCYCSRKEIVGSGLVGINGSIYPGNCRNNSVSLKSNQLRRHGSLRVKTDNRCIELTDRLQGSLSQCINRDIGDFVLRRADGLFAYQLAVVVDDAKQRITHVVRGADLLDSTPQQVFLQQLLGYRMPVYMHLPIVTDERGKKLSKQSLAAPVRQINVLSQLIAVLKFLGHHPPDELRDSNLETFWEWAIQHWRVGNIPVSGRSVNHCI